MRQIGINSMKSWDGKRCQIEDDPDMLCKISNGLTPQYLRTNLPSRQIGSFRDQDPNKFQEFFCNTKRYMNSFYPDSIRSWNNIGVQYSSSNSISIFKNHILNLIRPKEKSVLVFMIPLVSNIFFS